MPTLAQWCKAVQTAASLTPPCLRPMSRIRLTISVDQQVHDVFARMSAASGLSLSRVMGDWLADTSEGAQFVAGKMEALRRFARVADPQSVIDWEVSAAEAGDVSVLPAARRSRAAGSPGTGRSPPPSNTGGKPPRTSKRPIR